MDSRLIRLDEYLCGGYYVVRPVARPKSFSDLLPETLISISNCIADIAPDFWAVDWLPKKTDEERKTEAAKFGIPAEVVPKLVRWFTQEAETGFPNAFATIEVARHFCREFSVSRDCLLIGIGLHRSLLPSFRSELDKDVNRGLGVLERLESGVPPAPGRSNLGFEPLAYGGCQFHSWLCHPDLPDEISERLSVVPSVNGLIGSFEEAAKATEFIARPETGAEPEIWEPWLLIDYHW